MRTTAGLILLSAGAEAFTHWGVSRTPRTLRGSQMRMSASEESEDSFSLADAVVPAMAIGLGLMGGFGTGMDAMALTKDDVGALSYKQIKGTGLANRCAEVRETGTLKLQSGKKYEMIDFCLEPKIFRVVEEDKELPTRLTSRQTYTLDALMGPVSVDGGKVTFKETEGIDFAPTTVQIPSGERVPFLFAAKDLVLTSDSSGGALAPGTEMEGKFRVPGYRTGLFLDPKGRGGVTGYDMAVALPALQTGVEGDVELQKENEKVFESTKGAMVAKITNVNAETGEISGIFSSQQKSDTDLGSKVPKDMLLRGIFYGKIQQTE